MYGDDEMRVSERAVVDRSVSPTVKRSDVGLPTRERDGRTGNSILNRESESEMAGGTMHSRSNFFTSNDRHQSRNVHHLVQSDRLLWIWEGRPRGGCVVPDLHPGVSNDGYMDRSCDETDQHPKLAVVSVFRYTYLANPTVGDKTKCVLSATLSHARTSLSTSHSTPHARQSTHNVKAKAKSKAKAITRTGRQGDSLATKKRQTRRHPPLLDEYVRPKKHRLGQQTRSRTSEQLCHVDRTMAHISICMSEWYPSFACCIFSTQGWVRDGYARGEIEWVVSSSSELDKSVGNS